MLNKWQKAFLYFFFTVVEVTLLLIVRWAFGFEVAVFVGIGFTMALIIINDAEKNEQH